MRSLTIMLIVLYCPITQAAEKRTINVSAKSEIKVEPDEVLLNLAIHTRDKHLSIAKRDNDEISSKVIPLATSYSIAAKNVKITGLNIRPDYGDYDNRSVTPIAFEFIRSVEIRLTDFKNIEPFLSDAIEAGITNVSRLHFRVSNQREHQFKARKLAMIYAREKAEHLTELANMKLGFPIHIKEDIEYNWNAGGFGGAMGAAATLPQNPSQKAYEKIGPYKQGLMFVALQKDKKNNKAKLLVAPGQIKISAEVMVEFEMSPK